MADQASALTAVPSSLGQKLKVVGPDLIIAANPA